MRLTCIIPGCQRTARSDHYWGATEIICSVHWRPLPKLYRRVYARAMRRASHNPGGSLRFHLSRERLWRRLKRAAIERAAGIA